MSFHPIQTVHNPTLTLPATMPAMVMLAPNRPLERQTLPLPLPAAQQVLIRVIACGVCRTDLHILDGELPNPRLPLIPGHEIVGEVVKTGKEVSRFQIGDKVGVPWLGHTCGRCAYCLRGQENLCEEALFTGYTLNGGYAGYTVAFEKYCFRLPDLYAGTAGAPLLCAGLIGFRSYRLAGERVEKLGIYGFGAAAHLLTQLAVHEGKKVYAFSRKGDWNTQQFALSLGATWAGDSSQSPPDSLDAAIIFAPAGNLVPKALFDIDKGGIVVCGGIHMSDIPSFPYRILWGERMIRSVANLTREDGEAYFRLAPEVPVKAETEVFPLEMANEALERLRQGALKGAAVLDCSALPA